MVRTVGRAVFQEPLQTVSATNSTELTVIQNQFYYETQPIGVRYPGLYMLSYADEIDILPGLHFFIHVLFWRASPANGKSIH